MSIFNSQGENVYEAQYSGVLHTLNLYSLGFSSGLFWVRVSNGNEVFVKRFVVE
jgi:hypothetical protein